MRLVCLLHPGCFGPWTNDTVIYFIYEPGESEKFMKSCHSYRPGFRFVTVEAAREDYGVKVPPC